MAKTRYRTINHRVVHIFLPYLFAKCGIVIPKGCIMTEAANVPEVVDFREEARGCVQLAKDEKHEAVRTVLLGMALGYLKLSDRAKFADAIELRPDEVRPLNG
jgi:hypothetical protein